jgi:HSP20 family molecular chaperone IbpA
MKGKVKGIHDITTSLYRSKVGGKKGTVRSKRSFVCFGGLPEGERRFFKKSGEVITSPRVWAFSTKPKFRRYQKPMEKTLCIERIEEPKTDVFKKMGNLVIMAELPKVKTEDIQWEVNGDIFSIRAQDRFNLRKYIKEILLPFVVEEANIETTCRNGIFEITFRRKKGMKK